MALQFIEPPHIHTRGVLLEFQTGIRCAFVHCHAFFESCQLALRMLSISLGVVSWVISSSVQYPKQELESNGDLLNHKSKVSSSNITSGLWCTLEEIVSY